LQSIPYTLEEEDIPYESNLPLDINSIQFNGYNVQTVEESLELVTEADPEKPHTGTETFNLDEAFDPGQLKKQTLDSICNYILNKFFL